MTFWSVSATLCGADPLSERTSVCVIGGASACVIGTVVCPLGSAPRRESDEAVADRAQRYCETNGVELDGANDSGHTIIHVGIEAIRLSFTELADDIR
eukprot:9516388-Lingulodinium_polyedra.AAC.1